MSRFSAEIERDLLGPRHTYGIVADLAWSRLDPEPEATFGAMNRAATRLLSPGEVVR
ncbi:MAG TPA: hypothetical protein VH306_05620 [Gaiellaceae bacterium]|jgi:hypothetical protein